MSSLERQSDAAVGRYEPIPDELKERPQWLLWDDSSDTPKQPHWRGDFGISWSNPDDWHTFEEATQAASERESWGIGYVMALDNPKYPDGKVGCIDLDGCVREAYAEKPKSWVPSFDPFIKAGAYMEFSASGEGIHIPFVGDTIPEKWSDCHLGEHEGIDILTNKFCAFTATPLEVSGSELADTDLTPWLSEAYTNITGETLQVVEQTPERYTRASDDLEKATIKEALDCLNPDMSHTEWVRVGFAVHDWDSGNTGQSVFEQWSRRGSKFDREAERTIEWIWSNASEGQGVTVGTLLHKAKQYGFEPPQPRLSTPNPKGEDDTNGSWQDVRGLFNSGEKGTTTEAYALAVELLTDEFSFANIRDTGEFYYFHPERGYYVRKGESFIQEELERQIPGQLNDNRVRNITNKVKRTSLIDADEFTPPAGKVCVENGVLDLDTRTLESHSPAYYFTSRLQTPYDPDADTTRWPEFLEESVPSDTEARKLEEFIGYCLEPWHHNREKNLFVVGPRQSGKSTYLHVLQSLFGGPPTVTNLTPQQITGKRFDAANLKEAMLNAVNDINSSKIEDSGTLKRVFSGERLKLERKHQDAHFGAPKAKHAYTANWLPSVVGQDESLYRRVLVVEFPNKVSDDDRDEDLKDTLVGELSGILNRALDARDRLHEQNGFTNDRGDTATRQMWDSWQDAHKRFLYTQFEITANSDDTVEKETYYRAYKEFAGRNGYQLKPKQAVTKALKWVPEIGVPSDASEYTGLQWCEEDAATTATQTSLNTQQDRIRNVKQWVRDFSTPLDGAKREEVEAYAQEQGYEAETISTTIDHLLKRGELQNPQGDELEVT